MTLYVDRQADTLNLRIDDSTIAEPEEISPSVTLDYNEAKDVDDVEMLGLSQGTSHLDVTGTQFEIV